MLKQNTNRNFKFYVMRSLAKLIRHIQVFDDLPGFLQPIFDLLLDPDYEVRYFVRCVCMLDIVTFLYGIYNLHHKYV